MLLPSDVARLVLGYLQQENLISTCQTFILESSNLKEYAEHYTDEGFIPACLLSLFGKNLTTILNEYVAMKAKETTNDVPAMMSSLWKKLDHTLSQIRSMQSSPGFAANQRARTRSGIAEMKRQRKFASQAVTINSELSSLPYQTGQYASNPLAATQVIRPMNQNTTQFRTNSAFVSQPPDNITTTDSLHIVVPVPQERKIHSSLMSPGRRKSESQRKNITFSGPQSTVRNFQDPNAFTVEKQMVIENAREKILSNKSLQEKLAENINKFLISDSNIAQVPKQADSNPTEQEASIDEILGLQSEIHMSEEAIQDILEQTESDPAFQALFDLFDYGKAKNNKSISQGISNQHLETNQNVLVEETNLAVGNTFGTEQSNDHSVESTFCTDYHTEETSCALKDGNGDDHLKKQETQEQCVPMGSTLQKETFKAPSCVASEQRCNLEITFESVPNLNDFNQRGNSGPECNEQCTELYTNQLSNENEMALEIGKDSSVSNTPNTSELHPDQSNLPLASFASLDEVAESNENLTSHGKNSNHFLPNISLTGKSSQKNQCCESPSDSVKLKTIFHSSKSPDCSEMQQNKIETNDILPIASHQSSDCLDDSSNNTVLLGSVHSSGLNLSDQHKVEGPLEESVTSSKPSSSQSFVDSHHLESKGLPSEPSNSEEIALESQEPSSSVKEDGGGVLLSPSKSVDCREIEIMPTESNPTEYSHSVPSESLCSSVGEINTEPQSTGEYEHSKDSSTEVDPSNIVSLKIIISDDPFVSTDTELNNAVSSITGENLPTIILSSPAKSPVKNVGLVKCLTSEETSNTVLSAEKVGDSTLVEQSLLVLKPKDTITNNIQNDDCSAFSTAITPSVSQDGGFIQLMPATSTTFGNSNNILIATCVTDPTTLGTAVTQSNVVVLPNNSAPIGAQPPPPQQLQTPPRSNSMFAVNQAVSPNFSQGSAIIIASPVQPVLQGMVGMIPVSVVGQNGNTFPAPPRQVLHMPLAAPVCNRSVPKLPIPPKSQKVQGTRNKPSTVPGKLTTSLGDSLSHPVGFHTHRTLIPEKNLATDLGKKLEDTTIPLSTDSTVSAVKPHESHRRVLCFDTSPGVNTQGSNTKTLSQNKERNDIPFVTVDPPTVSSSIVKSSLNIKKEREKSSGPKILSQSETASSRNTAVKETQPEKKNSLAGLVLDSFHKATANKENELQRDVERQKNQEATKLSNGHQNSPLWNDKTSAASVQELTKKQGPSGNSKNTVSTGTLSKELKREQTKSASPLTKNSVEKLHDLHWHSPTNRLPSSGDLPIPRTPGSGIGEKHKEEACDSIQTSSTRRFTDENGTPKGMIPPATPDLPACSPASETGSENSVNMAAHTLMILSRAAISRTTSKPLKDNTQQFRSSRSTTKKRKLEDLDECDRTARSSNKNLPNSTVQVKKKKIKKKKLPNSFPAGMDVDKFLLSLHYDE
ncbi:protein NPAT isoform X1 [Antechinus flavipes]|uniref:protein NPAT isoform X1 n=2 Tax=Antechinus flavipes TaxID=38775 RepID=UPI0022356340|nr:protein NPAT isoform X1 [Antechinus flavipes]